MPADTYLRDILVAHRRRAAADRRDLDALREQAERRGASRGFRRALAGAADDGLAVIAEVKRRSPSKGNLDPTLDPITLARDYARGGAACLSVLTDAEFFGGSPDDLAAARDACTLPVLRKDFTVCPADVLDAKLMGADAVLLIVAALEDQELVELHGLAGAIGLDALVEVHDEAELARALETGARLVGVNQRDLRTFAVDQERAVRLAARIPEEVVAVAESGIRDAGDTARLAQAGYDAVLVGETLVRSADRVAATAALRGAERRPRGRPTADGVPGAPTTRAGTGPAPR